MLYFCCGAPSCSIVSFFPSDLQAKGGSTIASRLGIAQYHALAVKSESQVLEDTNQNEFYESPSSSRTHPDDFKRENFERSSREGVRYLHPSHSNFSFSASP